MTRFRRAALAGLLSLPLLAGGFALQSRQDRSSAQLLDQVLTLVSSRYVDTLAAQQLYEQTARGLVKELGDPYSELFSPKDMESFMRTTTGRYAGLGVLLTPPVDGYVMIEKVYPNSPAESRGVQEGDRIVAVDSFATARWSVERVQSKLLGERGTPVAVTFRRPGLNAPLTLRFTRADIKVPAVAYHLMLDDQIGYIPLARFSERTTDDVASAVTALRKSGAKSIVLDLRGNPGGIVDEAFGMANLFLPRGKELLTVRERGGSEPMIAEREPLAPDIPLAVLVDGGSASAAEIVAGALQDYDRALLVGTTTFGKGLVQSVYSLDGGYALKLTTGKWYTPSGRSIQKPRHFSADGQWVEEASDSLETDAARAARPTYKSASGRTLYGGGAITPDLIVPADTITTAELRLRRLLAPYSQQYFDGVNAIAEGLRGRVKEDFRVDPAWREALYRKLAADSVVIDRDVFDAARADIDRALEGRVAKVSFGEAVERQHQITEDNQLQRALAILRKATTQAQVFAAAKT